MPRRYGTLGKQPKTKAGKAFSYNRLVRQLKASGARDPKALATYIARKRAVKGTLPKTQVRKKK
jgi:hypothetical protein